MAVSLVLNRQSLAVFRAVLNTWAAAINSLLTRMTTAESDIDTLQSAVATNTSDINTLEAEVAAINGKYGYTQRSSSGALGVNESGAVVEYTAASPLNFDLTAPTSISFETGNWFILTNLPSSSGDVTLTTPSGVTLIGSTTISTGTSALVVCKTPTMNSAIYIRIY